MKSKGMKNVPPKGKSPGVPYGTSCEGLFKGSTGEKGRATPTGMDKTGEKSGNPQGSK